MQKWPCQSVVPAGQNRKIDRDAPVAIFDQTGLALDAGNVDKVFSSLSIMVPIGGNCELLAESAKSVRIDPRSRARSGHCVATLSHAKGMLRS